MKYSLSKVLFIKQYLLASNLHWCSRRTCWDSVCWAWPDTSHLGRQNREVKLQSTALKGKHQVSLPNAPQLGPAVRGRTYTAGCWRTDSSVCSRVGGLLSASAPCQLGWGSAGGTEWRSVDKKNRLSPATFQSSRTKLTWQARWSIT